jgi:hypothetical protein
MNAGVTTVQVAKMCGSAVVVLAVDLYDHESETIMDAIDH